jgi:hypothetical protein
VDMMNDVRLIIVLILVFGLILTACGDKELPKTPNNSDDVVKNTSKLSHEVEIESLDDLIFQKAQSEGLSSAELKFYIDQIVEVEAKNKGVSKEEFLAGLDKDAFFIYSNKAEDMGLSMKALFESETGIINSELTNGSEVVLKKGYNQDYILEAVYSRLKTISEVEEDDFYEYQFISNGDIDDISDYYKKVFIESEDINVSKNEDGVKISGSIEYTEFEVSVESYENEYKVVFTLK